MGSNGLAMAQGRIHWRHRRHTNGGLNLCLHIIGQRSAVSGRVGYSFPIGKLNKPKPSQAMAKLVDQRDEQIAKLTEQLQQLRQSAGSSEANGQLIALLRERIEELEAEKQQADAENQCQDDKIKQLQAKLSQQQSLMERMMKPMKKLMPNGG